MPSEEEKQAMESHMAEQWAKRMTGACPNNQSAAKDTFYTGMRISMEVSPWCTELSETIEWCLGQLKQVNQRAGVAGLFMMTGSHQQDIVALCSYETKTAWGFLHNSLGHSVEDVEACLECFAITGAQGKFERLAVE
jgi:hypothetical protein